MTAAAARVLDAHSTDDDDDMIDVVSHAAAVPHHICQPNVGNGDIDGDDDEEEEDDEELDEYILADEEYAYRRGRHSVPMHSPGEDLSDIDFMGDQHLRGTSLPRLPRLRNRMFFPSDAVSTSSSANNNGASNTHPRLRRVLFRRRKRQEGDVFWTAIFVSSVLSLAVLACLVVYLTQTDFFASHQKELFGTTVDNRFTVVSQQDARAKIYLKSGYSNSRYAEAMIAFGDGVLQLGRRALTSTDAQRFYGLSLAHNGTATFTNKVSAPFVAAEYLHAGKAVVFADGSVMTTAAKNESSGGVKAVSDLNLVSANGSVVTSAGGRPVLIVDARGHVVVPSANADDPSAMGVVVDGTAGRISIGGAFLVAHSANTSTISTSAQALHVNATRVVFGTTSADRVTLTVPRPLMSSSAVASAKHNDDDNNDDGENNDDENNTIHAEDSDDTSDNDGMNTRARVLAPVKPTSLEIVGQSSSSQSQGGDVWIAGGDGLDRGGNVILAGGIGLDLADVRVGSVAINAQLDPAGASFTAIGTQGGAHVVHLQGAVHLNGNATATDNATQVAVGGAVFHVESQRVLIDNTATNASRLELDSRAIAIGKTAPLIEIGSSAANATVSIHAGTAALDGAQSVVVGATALHVSVGSAGRTGQLVELVSDSIRLSSSSSPASPVGNTSTASKQQSVADMTIANGSVRIDARRLNVGARGDTASIALSATRVTVGTARLNSSVAVRGSTFSVASDTIALGSKDSSTTIHGERISLDASDSIQVGVGADTIALGSNDTEDVSVAGKTLAFEGATRIVGASLRVDSTAIALGGNVTTKVTVGDASTKQTTVAGNAVEVGVTATTVAIGTESPAVAIGSTAGVINLRGTVVVAASKVMLNGATLESRDRSLRAVENWFAYVSTERFAVDVVSPHHEFVVPASDHFVSSAETAAAVVRDASAAILHARADAVSGHARLALTLSAVRLQTAAGNSERVSSIVGKLRCRVYRQRAESSLAVAVLEASGAVESCSGAACDDGIFFGIASERIVAFDGGDRFDVQCVVASRAIGRLLADSAQLSLTTL